MPRDLRRDVVRREYPDGRRDVDIHAPSIALHIGAMDYQLFDPERPQLDPNDLLREFGGKVTDPRSINYNCPLCYQTMRYDLFVAHARPCFKRYGSLIDPTLKQYRGVSLDGD